MIVGAVKLGPDEAARRDVPREPARQGPPREGEGPRHPQGRAASSKKDVEDRPGAEGERAASRCPRRRDVDARQGSRHVHPRPGAVDQAARGRCARTRAASTASARGGSIERVAAPGAQRSRSGSAAIRSASTSWSRRRSTRSRRSRRTAPTTTTSTASRRRSCARARPSCARTGFWSGWLDERVPLRRRSGDRARHRSGDEADDERERQGRGEALPGSEEYFPGGAAAGEVSCISAGPIRAGAEPEQRGGDHQPALAGGVVGRERRARRRELRGCRAAVQDVGGGDRGELVADAGGFAHIVRTSACTRTPVPSTFAPAPISETSAIRWIIIAASPGMSPVIGATSRVRHHRAAAPERDGPVAGGELAAERGERGGLAGGRGALVRAMRSSASRSTCRPRGPTSPKREPARAVLRRRARIERQLVAVIEQRLHGRRIDERRCAAGDRSCRRASSR